MEILRKLSIWLATQLDKLKVASPIVYVILQGLLVTLFTLFANNTLNVPTPEVIAKVLAVVGLTDLDAVFTTVLGFLVAAVSPRTSKLKAEALNGK